MTEAPGGRGPGTLPGPDGVDWERVRESLERARGAWVVPLLRHLATGASSPMDLLEAVNQEQEETGGRSLSRAMMFKTLHRMQRDGLVDGESTRDVVPPVASYWLTPGGHALLTLISRLDPAVSRPPGPLPVIPEVPGPGIDISRPSPARVWNWTLGGKDNYAVDRAAGAAVLEAMPSLAHTARLARLFQADVVGRLVAAGFRQFLDIGTGLPVAGSVHQVAQRAAPDSRVAYVDNDPIVLAHARALLKSSPQGRCAYIHADLRNPEHIIAQAAETLDLGEPVAVLAIMVLHFIPDEADPWGIVRRLLRGINGPAAFAVGHAAAEHSAEHSAGAAQQYNARSPFPVTLRRHEEVARFFDGLDIQPPGLVTLADWLPHQASGLPDLNGHVGMGTRLRAP